MFDSFTSTLQAAIKDPHPKQEWNAEGTEIIEYEDVDDEHWLELFSDLVFVAFLMNLDESVYACGNSPRVLLRVFKFFIIFFSCRIALVSTVTFACMILLSRFYVYYPPTL